MSRRWASSFGWRVWGAGIAAMGLVDLALGKLDPGQPVPRWVPGRAALAYAADGFMLAGGLALQWRPLAASAARALTAYYAVIVVIVLNGPPLLAHPASYGSYEAIAEQAAIAAAGVIACAGPGMLLARAAQAAFGICAVVFGGAHFAYPLLTAPLVPRWLPPSQAFWADATGICQIAAGLAIAGGIRARLAAILLTVMYTGFTLLVHLPLLIGAPRNAFFWTENALNLALIGSAWVVADFAARRGSAGR